MSEFDPFARPQEPTPEEMTEAEVDAQLSTQPLSDTARAAEPLTEALSTLTTARSLLPADYDEDEGDFEPSPEGTRYKGFLLVAPSEWPPEAHVWPSEGVAGHANQKARFYVLSPAGRVGLVPWPGSKVVWPWDAGWLQDAYRSEVTPLLKDEKEKKK